MKKVPQAAAHQVDVREERREGTADSGTRRSYGGMTGQTSYLDCRQLSPGEHETKARKVGRDATTVPWASGSDTVNKPEGLEGSLWDSLPHLTPSVAPELAYSANHQPS